MFQVSTALKSQEMQAIQNQNSLQPNQHNYKLM